MTLLQTCAECPQWNTTKPYSVTAAQLSLSHTHAQTDTQTDTHTNKYTHTQTHTHTHTHTHRQKSRCSVPGSHHEEGHSEVAETTQRDVNYMRLVWGIVVQYIQAQVLALAHQLVHICTQTATITTYSQCTLVTAMYVYVHTAHTQPLPCFLQNLTHPLHMYDIHTCVGGPDTLSQEMQWCVDRAMFLLFAQ